MDIGTSQVREKQPRGCIKKAIKITQKTWTGSRSAGAAFPPHHTAE